MSTDRTNMNRSQAEFYRALADHLDTHPDLAPVNVRNAWDPEPSLQIAARVAQPVTEADVHAWAASLGARPIRVELTEASKGWLIAEGVIGATPVELWTAVDGSYVVGQEIAVTSGA